MLKSMTAFGRAAGGTGDGGREFTAEIRSVNSRYLDVSIRLPRSMSGLEERIKAYLGERGIRRGKMEITIGVSQSGADGTSYALDTEAAASYLAALAALRDTFSLKDDISVMQVAQNPNVFTMRRAEADEEQDWTQMQPVLAAAIDAFLARRMREGENLTADIRGKLDTIRACVAKIRLLSAADIAGYPEKLTQRIRRFLDDFDVQAAEDRILTEAAIYADRAAIDEELVRLESHFGAMEDILTADEPGGRKLDFLLQEMNREINTIGSKAGNAEIAHLVVDVKCELEKIREQIQNIE